MTITFVGHFEVPEGERIKKLVKEVMIKKVSDVEEVICYIGGYGEFDGICAVACKELRNLFPQIKVIYVTPYIHSSAQNKIETMKKSGLCDASIYPSLENVPRKFAILKRNEWMVANSDFVIAYVKHNFGGAYKTVKTAYRMKKNVVNICELCDK